MNSDNNVWAEALKAGLDDSTDNIVPLMEEQCRLLEEATGGIVRGRFAEIKLARNPFFGGQVGSVAAYLSQAAKPTEENVLPQEDIGPSYDKNTYGFDIYNDNYKYRPFEVEFGPVYPASVSVDETIWRESKEEFRGCLPFDCLESSGSAFDVYDDDTLMDCFRIVVKSRKMSYILQQLMSA